MLQDIYGDQWSHGDEPTIGWVYALRDFSAEQLRRGIDNLANRENNRYPPNAAEFAQLCALDTSWERRCHKPFPLALENKTELEASRAIGRQVCADLMKLFGSPR